MTSRMLRQAAALLLALTLLFPSAAALTADQTRTLLLEKFIGDVPDAALALDTPAEIAAALGDPYTRYLTAEEYQAFQDSLRDTSLVGIGVTARLETGVGLVIAGVLDHSPAQEAGLTAGDIISAIDGRPIAETDAPEAAVALLQGEAGTPVTLELLRDGRIWSETLIRRAVAVPRTTSALWDDTTAYLNCTAFGAETYEHFASALAGYGGVRKWVVDLRVNGGGMVQASADTVGIFVDSGAVAYLQDSSGQYLVCVPDAEGVRTIFPVLVLTGAHTASSAELFASAVRDRRGGLVIGQRTFGKGLAQEVLDQTHYPDYFPDGDALLISSMRFYSAGQTTTDQVGVIPNLVVDPALAEDVAALLGTTSPGDAEGWLRLHLGGWRWYLNLEQALSPDYLPAFAELLAAVHPEDDLFQWTEDSGWTAVTAQTLAAQYVPDFSPRTFADAADSPYQTAIDALAIYGLIQGDDAGNFASEQPLTRAHLCALLSQALNLRPGEMCPFSDVPANAWYADDAAALYREGLITGTDAGLLCPDAPISHEQLAVLMARTAAWLSAIYDQALEIGPNADALADPVLAAYSSWAQESAWLMGRSTEDLWGSYLSMLWDDLEEIDPLAVTTRGEAAECLYRVLTFTGVLQG